jgi:hypothetical protein
MNANTTPRSETAPPPEDATEVMFQAPVVLRVLWGRSEEAYGARRARFIVGLVNWPCTRGDSP